MSESNNNLENLGSEEAYYNNLIENKVGVYVYLINGIKLSGVLAVNNVNVIILRSSDGQSHQMIYKNSISTIVPNIVKNKRA